MCKSIRIRTNKIEKKGSPKTKEERKRYKEIHVNENKSIKVYKVKRNIKTQKKTSKQNSKKKISKKGIN